MKLDKKIGIATSIVIVIMGIITIFVLHRLIQQNFEEQLQENGRVIVQLAAEEIVNPLLDKEMFYVQTFLERLKETNQSIEYAYIKGLEGDLIIHTFSSGFPKELLAINPLDEGVTYHTETFSSEKGQIKDLGYRVIEKMPYEIHLGMSQFPLQSLLQKTTESIALLTFEGILLGIAVAMIMSRFITRPLKLLTNKVQIIDVDNIEWDQFSTFAKSLKGNDEVSELANAFQQMINKIRNYIEEIETSQKNLLKRNHELLLLNEISRDIGGRVEIPKLLNSASEEILSLMELDGVTVFLFPRGISVDEEDLDLDWLKQKSNYYGYGSCKGEQSLANRQCWLSIEHVWRSFHQLKDFSHINNCIDLLCLHHNDINQGFLEIIPLIAQRELLGFFSVCKTKKTLDKNDLTTLATVGSQLGIAIANRKLWEKLEEREKKLKRLLTQVIHAQEDERKRIARELHDETSQTLTALSVGLKSAAIAIEKEPEKGIQLLETLKGQLNQINLEIQKIIQDLRPSMLDDLGLLPAIRWLITHRLHLAGMEAKIRVEGSPIRLLPEIETTIYRIVQESLINATKYSQAKLVQIELNFNVKNIEGIITDNGIGFDYETMKLQKKGLGLMGMKERAKLIGGELQIHTSLGKGTNIKFFIPIEPLNKEMEEIE